MERKKRIDLMDAARGLSLFLMVYHHFFYDLMVFAGAPQQIFYNPVLELLQLFFAGVFVLISGVSSNFSHSNVRRGLKTLAIALLVTLVTTLMNMPIVFGILHLLGTCMLLYGLTQGFWQKLSERAAWAVPALCALGVLATGRLVHGLPSATPHLWMFGLVTPDFVSADYFPLLPWIFIFLLGAWAGKYVREGRLPRWFYDTQLPFFPALGRHSLLVYILHQPVLYGLTMFIVRLHGIG